VNRSNQSVALHSAVEQLALLRAKKISPLELAEEYIARIERLNPALNAFVDFDAERARTAARAAENSQERGALFGLPLSIKSSIAVAGYRCENGSLLQRGQIPAEDAVAVAQLRRAGAWILGTTNCPEFLMAYETDNLLYGRTANPWDTARTAGGSSGGESAAIAAGLSAAGLGSDSGGSVRQPAHCTGICSLKPTPGRLSSWGHILPCVGPFASLGSIGPMARTVGDVALLFELLAGTDAADPISAPVPLRRYSREDLRQIPIAWFEDDGHTPVTQETRRAVQDAAAALDRQGFRVQRFRPQGLEQARQLWWKFFVQCGAALLAPSLLGKEGQLSPTLLDFLSIAHSLPPLTVQGLLETWAECDLLRRQFLIEMQAHPILLCPVSALPAFGHGERAWTIEGQAVTYLDAMRYTQWFNTLAMPAAVVPVGRSPEGLPIGVQIAGRPYDDEIVLAIAAAIEQDFGYTVPPMAKLG
jgi:Asp-tRNA(Asn)/Glu-tRNA(Gln) amidotransferase A subunit family amidase